LRGALLHASLGRFTERFPDALPPDPEAELMQIARAVLAEVAAHPRSRAFWVPRLQRFARWFGETEAGRRTGVAATRAELDGEHILAAPAGPFTLRARADRIDVRADGIVITDYKTARGIDEMARRAVSGEAPQLPLEAAIARAGGFAHVDDRRVVGLRYVSASGGEPAGEEAMVDADDLGRLASDVEAALGRLVAMYDDPSTPYRAVRRARFRYDFDDYAQLARVAEWSGRDETDEDAP
jgi:ATP-dependent helicase/nuclease subunit B